MRLTYDKDLFALYCNVIDNPLAKRMGFVWNKDNQRWETPFADIAAKAIRFAGNPAKELIDKIKAEEHGHRLRSASAHSDLGVPVPKGLELRPYQKAGVDWIINRENALLGDEMGLGKTIQAITACNIICPESVLIVCPASLKLNWEREWQHWSTTGLTTNIINGSKWLESQVTIINYDILDRHYDKLRQHKWDVMILDEAHYLKNPKTKRCKQILGGRMKVKDKWTIFKPIEAARKIVLTGTAITNKTIDLYPLLKLLSPKGWPSWHDFGMRYCGPVRGFRGWEFKGSSNEDELQRKLRSSIMIRRLKRDVLTDLPAKIRQIIEVSPNAKMLKLLKLEKDMVKDMGDNYEEIAKSMGSGDRVLFEEMARVRREIGNYKVDIAIKHIQEIIDSGQKAVAFVHHIEVADQLHEHFKNTSVLLYGKTSPKNKDTAVNKFQNDDKIRLFIGNIKAAGVGLTLTAASIAVFIEGSWVPSELTQAEDRLHRIGQRNSVLVQHLVLAGSLDAHMIRTAVHKQEIIDKSLNEETDKFLEEMLS